MVSEVMGVLVRHAPSVVGLASGTYGVVEAGRNGMYATAVVGAVLLAVAAYKLMQGTLRDSAADSSEMDDLRKKCVSTLLWATRPFARVTRSSSPTHAPAVTPQPAHS